MEVLARVDYRFKKIFNFKIGKKKFNYEYFVGKKKINYKLKENKIRSLLIKKKLIKITKLGRFECWSINSKNLSKTILQTLQKNSYFLIK